MTSTQADISPKSLDVCPSLSLQTSELVLREKNKNNHWYPSIIEAFMSALHCYAYRRPCNHAKFHVVDKTSFQKTKRKKKRNFIETLLRLNENITIKRLLPLSLRCKISPTLPWRKLSEMFSFMIEHQEQHLSRNWQKILESDWGDWIPPCLVNNA